MAAATQTADMAFVAPASSFLGCIGLRSPTASANALSARPLPARFGPAARPGQSQKHNRAILLLRATQTAPSVAATAAMPLPGLAQVGLVGLAVMGQNLALNIADHGFKIAVFNRSHSKTLETVARAKDENLADKLVGFETVEEFVKALERPRKIIMLVKAGAPVDATIDTLKNLLDEGDLIVDGGNEFYSNTERRSDALEAVGIRYMGMGVSGGEDGARYGPSLMPGGPKEGYQIMESMLESIAAQVDDGPCVTYIGPRGAGNFVKMVHNGIEYGDMQIVGEVYDLMRTVAGMAHNEIADVFDEWNKVELQSFLIEITAKLLRQHDDVGPDPTAFLIEKVLDQTGSKGTGMWTVQEAAALAVPAPTIAAALDARYVSALKEGRVAASSALTGPAPDHQPPLSPAEKKEFIQDIRTALYASKICSYAQGMNIIREAGIAGKWGLDLGAIARIWKGGCIIRAKFLDRIKAAYDRNPDLPNLLVDAEFAAELSSAQDGWRRVVCKAVTSGLAAPALSGSLAYYDSYRRETLPSAQMVQSQRDFFGSHTYKRNDMGGVYHTRWSSDGVSVKQD
jgi:6-phosphogluconate dehydrogenase